MAVKLRPGCAQWFSAPLGADPAAHIPRRHPCPQRGTDLVSESSTHPFPDIQPDRDTHISDFSTDVCSNHVSNYYSDAHVSFGIYRGEFQCSEGLSSFTRHPSRCCNKRL